MNKKTTYFIVPYSETNSNSVQYSAYNVEYNNKNYIKYVVPMDGKRLSLFHKSKTKIFFKKLDISYGTVINYKKYIKKYIFESDTDGTCYVIRKNKLKKIKIIKLKQSKFISTDMTGNLNLINVKFKKNKEFSVFKLKMM